MSEDMFTFKPEPKGEPRFARDKKSTEAYQKRLASFDLPEDDTPVGAHFIIKDRETGDEMQFAGGNGMPDEPLKPLVLGLYNGRLVVDKFLSDMAEDRKSEIYYQFNGINYKITPNREILKVESEE